MVIWPASHEQVEMIVTAAVQHNVCIIPYGGGTRYFVEYDRMYDILGYT